MELDGFNHWLEKRRIPQDQIDAAVKDAERYSHYVHQNKTAVRTAEPWLLKKYLKNFDTSSAVMNLVRLNHYAGNIKCTTYLQLILERETVRKNIEKRITSLLGNEDAQAVLSSLPFPAGSEPPESVLDYTAELTARLTWCAGEEKAERILAGNAHGIPAAAFEKDKLRFRQLESLEKFLVDLHQRNVDVLKKHADEHTLWFEQEIDHRVVKMVENNPEMLGGVYTNGEIFITKIPYNPIAWLDSSDPVEKRYLACHCPMAREVLNPAGRSPVKSIPPIWCSCSAGFAAQRFNAVFDRELESRVVSSVLAGDSLCRFALAGM